ncbi:acetyl-CoA carboxylase biotin carboxyl carrier protein [Candidatus Liberibacter africanus]|uniref:acetyl-CoA carboxylase biotin carboxyl carrier protein n=1 Tax=Liberibacter africanus TaxID=34020 RepID=UPI001FCE189B|nr:acetyl-CoA carboxylase biotin carboxyl carrier protein subunit [Candidatus Liberibacter africanus]
MTEVEIDTDGMRIRLLRSPQKDVITNCYYENHKISNSSVEITTSSVMEDPRCESKTDPLPISDNSHTVTSPMVGTAYLASSPGSDPFVNKGSAVLKGQTIIIIEAMKTMNPILAPCSGTVIDIKVQDGQLVEYGDALLVLKKKEDNK